MKKFVFVCLFFLFATSVLASPQASLTKRAVNLGQLTEGNIYEHKFYIQNVGDSDLVLDVARSNCGCIRILEPQTQQHLSAGAKIEIRFSFNTLGMVGDVAKHIFIRTNDLKNPILKIIVNAAIEGKKNVILDRFKSFSIGTVTTAGLIDGVNPCAFTVLVFFISFLTFVGYRRKQILILGSFFILAVFLTYLGIGLGLFEALHRLAIFTFLSRVIIFIAGISAFILGVFSLYDWWIYSRTKDPDMIRLKLPALIKRKIQSVIRQKTDDRGDSSSENRSIIKLIMTALSCGFIVSLLESVCTGQLYFPTIVFVLGMPELKIKAFSYLLLYNLMFIAPLLIIFGFALFGVSSQGFAKIARMHLAKVKILAAGVFFGLAFIILFFIRN